MKPRKRILITIGIGIVLIVAFYFITSAISRTTGFTISGNGIADNGNAVDSKLGDCLKKQDIKLYVSDSSDETLKNAGAYDYLEFIKIQDCSVNNNGCNGPLPLWVINSKQVQGTLSVEQLKAYAGC